MMAESIKKTGVTDDFVIVDLRRRREHNNVISFAAGRVHAFVSLLKCAISSNSHGIVSHPFNLWCALFIRLSARVSHYDDGVAYYCGAKTPHGIFPSLYARLSRTVSVRDLGKISYLEYLQHSGVATFYCLFPELVKILTKPTLVLVRPHVKESFGTSSNNVVAFLDSSPSIVSRINVARVIDTLHAVARGCVSGKIYFKRHPSSESSISRELRKMDWAIEMSGEFEAFVKERSLSRLYSIYSSATLSTYLLSPSTSLFCFTGEGLGDVAVALDEVFQRLGVKSIEV